MLHSLFDNRKSNCEVMPLPQPLSTNVRKSVSVLSNEPNHSNTTVSTTRSNMVTNEIRIISNSSEDRRRVSLQSPPRSEIYMRNSRSDNNGSPRRHTIDGTLLRSRGTSDEYEPLNRALGMYHDGYENETSIEIERNDSDEDTRSTPSTSSCSL